MQKLKPKKKKLQIVEVKPYASLWNRKEPLAFTRDLVDLKTQRTK